MSLTDTIRESNSVDGLIELLTVDCTNVIIDGVAGQKYYFTTSGMNVYMGGIYYVPLPFELSNQGNSLNNPPQRPSLSIAFDKSTMMASLVLAMKPYIIAAHIEYKMTLKQYLDNGTNPNPAETTPPENYKVIQINSLSRKGINLSLASAIDTGTIILPRRQCLRSPGISYAVYAPGLAR